MPSYCDNKLGATSIVLLYHPCYELHAKHQSVCESWKMQTSLSRSRREKKSCTVWMESFFLENQQKHTWFRIFILEYVTEQNLKEKLFTWFSPFLPRWLVTAGHLRDASSLGCVSFVVGYFPGFSQEIVLFVPSCVGMVWSFPTVLCNWDFRNNESVLFWTNSVGSSEKGSWGFLRAATFSVDSTSFLTYWVSWGENLTNVFLRCCSELFGLNYEANIFAETEYRTLASVLWHLHLNLKQIPSWHLEGA